MSSTVAGGGAASGGPPRHNGANNLAQVAAWEDPNSRFHLLNAELIEGQKSLGLTERLCALHQDLVKGSTALNAADVAQIAQDTSLLISNRAELNSSLEGPVVLQKSQELFPQISDCFERGTSHLRQQHYSDAVSEFQKGLCVYSELGHDARMERMQGLIGSRAALEGEFEEEAQFFQKHWSDLLSSEYFSRPEIVSELEASLGLIQAAKGKDGLAHRCFRSAQESLGTIANNSDQEVLNFIQGVTRSWRVLVEGSDPVSDGLKLQCHKALLGFLLSSFPNFNKWESERRIRAYAGELSRLIPLPGAQIQNEEKFKEYFQDFATKVKTLGSLDRNRFITACEICNSLIDRLLESRASSTELEKVVIQNCIELGNSIQECCFSQMEDSERRLAFAFLQKAVNREDRIRDEGLRCQLHLSLMALEAVISVQNESLSHRPAQRQAIRAKPNKATSVVAYGQNLKIPNFVSYYQDNIFQVREEEKRFARLYSEDPKEHGALAGSLGNLDTPYLGGLWYIFGVPFPPYNPMDYLRDLKPETSGYEAERNYLKNSQVAQDLFTRAHELVGNGAEGGPSCSTFEISRFYHERGRFLEAVEVTQRLLDAVRRSSDDTADKQLILLLMTIGQQYRNAGYFDLANKTFLELLTSPTRVRDLGSRIGTKWELGKTTVVLNVDENSNATCVLNDPAYPEPYEQRVPLPEGIGHSEYFSSLMAHEPIVGFSQVSNRTEILGFKIPERKIRFRFPTSQNFALDSNLPRVHVELLGDVDPQSRQVTNVRWKLFNELGLEIRESPLQDVPATVQDFLLNVPADKCRDFAKGFNVVLRGNRGIERVNLERISILDNTVALTRDSWAVSLVSLCNPVRGSGYSETGEDLGHMAIAIEGINENGFGFIHYAHITPQTPSVRNRMQAGAAQGKSGHEAEVELIARQTPWSSSKGETTQGPVWVAPRQDVEKLLAYLTNPAEDQHFVKFDMTSPVYRRVLLWDPLTADMTDEEVANEVYNCEKWCRMALKKARINFGIPKSAHSPKEQVEYLRDNRDAVQAEIDTWRANHPRTDQTEAGGGAASSA